MTITVISSDGDVGIRIKIMSKIIELKNNVKVIINDCTDCPYSYLGKKGVLLCKYLNVTVSVNIHSIEEIHEDCPLKDGNI